MSQGTYRRPAFSHQTLLEVVRTGICICDPADLIGRLCWSWPCHYLRLAGCPESRTPSCGCLCWTPYAGGDFNHSSPPNFITSSVCTTPGGQKLLESSPCDCSPRRRRTRRSGRRQPTQACAGGNRILSIAREGRGVVDLVEVASDTEAGPSAGPCACVGLAVTAAAISSVITRAARVIGTQTALRFLGVSLSSFMICSVFLLVFFGSSPYGERGY